MPLRDCPFEAICFAMRCPAVTANGMMAADEKGRASMSVANTEWAEAERQEVFAEALHHPETAEVWAAQQARFRVWLNDPRYEHLRPMLERMIQCAPLS